MSQTDKEQSISNITVQRKLLREERKRVDRFNSMFVVTLVLLSLLVLVLGVLNLVKNSPDRNFVVLRDRKAPVVTVHDAVSANGQKYEIEDFVDDMQDISDVRMSYVTPPDYEHDGLQEVVIRFTDEAGNYTDKTLRLDVFHDTDAPVIYGDDDVYVFWNDSISYKSFVEVEDDYDEECQLDIDNSSVDVTKIGEYDVVYTATDSVGNSSQKTIKIHVLEPDSDEYYLMKANELCDRIISQIITDDMDDLHKVWAVYNYVREIPYVLTDYTRNYIREGYNMLSGYMGDCYGSYASVRLLLDRLGIMNIPIQTDEAYTTHFWNMVSLDGGNTWYHVDATNWTEWSYRPNMCMISDARLDTISAEHGGTHYHIYDDYPATPPESMPVPEDIAMTYGIWE